MLPAARGLSRSPRRGASVTGIDLTPQLLERARENGRIAEVPIEWHEGDAEKLPFDDARFDVVVSQFGHIFAPRPEVAIAEMLRVLKPGGTIAFSTWPPDKMVGRTMALSFRYMPPPPTEVPPPSLWGNPEVVRQRLGAAVRDVEFEQRAMLSPALSPQHFRMTIERTAGPMIKLVQQLGATNPQALEQFRREFDAIASEYLSDNQMRQDYLMTRAAKA